MKCRGIKCPRFFGKDYKWCYELSMYLHEDSECELLDNISKLRDELIRKCRLFEEVFEIDTEDWDELIDKIEP